MHLLDCESDVNSIRTHSTLYDTLDNILHIKVLFSVISGAFEIACYVKNNKLNGT